MKLSRLRICQVIVAYLVTAVAVAAADDKRDAVSPRAAEMRDQWILDGEAQLVVQGERELKVTATAPMALWCPEVFVGRVTVEFECMVPQPQTKLLVLLHGHGADGAAICDWKRDGTYDDYNASRMELYTIGINRGPHTSDKPDDRLANVRRIGGKEGSIYTAANLKPRILERLEHALADRRRTRAGERHGQVSAASRHGGPAAHPDGGGGRAVRQPCGPSSKSADARLSRLPLHDQRQDILSPKRRHRGSHANGAVND